MKFCPKCKKEANSKWIFVQNTKSRQISFEISLKMAKADKFHLIFCPKCEKQTIIIWYLAQNGTLYITFLVFAKRKLAGFADLSLFCRLCLVANPTFDILSKMRKASKFHLKYLTISWLATFSAHSCVDLPLLK